MYRPARLDLHESGITGKLFKRTSTALCFWFLIFDLEYLIRVQSSEPLHAKKIQPPACSVHGLHRILSSYWLAHWKNPPKCSSILVRVAEWWNFLPASRNPKTNWCLSSIYGIRFGEKDRGLSTYKPWTEQAGGLEAFLHGAAQDFEVVLNIQDQKLKIKNI